MDSHLEWESGASATGTTLAEISSKEKLCEMAAGWRPSWSSSSLSLSGLAAGKAPEVDIGVSDLTRTSNGGLL